MQRHTTFRPMFLEHLTYDYTLFKSNFNKRLKYQPMYMKYSPLYGVCVTTFAAVIHLSNLRAEMTAHNLLCPRTLARTQARMYVRICS